MKIIHVLFVISVCYLFYIYIYDGTYYVKSLINGNSYKVRPGKDKQKKADLLALLNLKLNTIVNALQNDENYKNNQDVQRLIKNWNKGISIKEIGKMERDAAYVINKRHMSFCLERYDNQADINLMTYVGIHELAHVMSVEIGHDKEFIKNFQFLLNYAKTITYAGEPLYIDLNKMNTADNYCGVKISNSIK